MTDVVGSASFELRAKKDRLAKDVRDAEADLKASVDRIERDYAQGGQKAAAAFGRSQKQMARDAKLAETEIRASAGRISAALIAAAGAFAVGAGANATVQLSDAYLRLTNSLKVAGLEGEALGQVQNALFATAIKNGVQVETLGQLYGRAAQAAGELGASQADLLQFTDGVSAAIRVQGGSAASASGAIIQLSQALQAGTVRAEEFNSINEGARPILEAVANGSERFGGSVAKLRAEVLAGTVTSQEFFAAFLKGSKDLEQRAAKSVLTVEQGMTNLQTALIKYVGESSAVQGATDALANGLKALAENLDIIIPSIAAISVGIGVAYVGGVVAASGATLTLTGIMGGLNAAMTLISRHPIIAALSIIAAGLAFVVVKGGEADASTVALAKSTDAAKTAFDRYEQAALAAAAASGESARQANLNAEEMRKEAQAALDSARAQAVRQRALAAAAATEAEAARNSPEGLRGDRALFDRRATEASVRARQAEINALLLEGDLYEIEQRIKASRTGSPPAGAGGAIASAGRPAAVDPAARETLELERDILAARAAGDEMAAKAAEERLLLAQTIQRYTRAGYEDAKGAALQEIAWLNEIEQLEMRRLAIAKLMGDYKEADLRRAEEAAEAAKAAEEDRLAREAEAAEVEARMRQSFRYAFRDGLRAAMDGDLGGFFESLADRFTDRLLENLADNLFDVLNSVLKGTPGGGIGGGILSAIGGFFGFGGGRAAGGPVRGGMAYRVGEAGPETLIMPSDGFVVPNGAHMGASGGMQRQRLDVVVSADRSGLTAYIRDQAGKVAGPLAVQAGSAAASYAKADTLGALQKQQSTRRGGSGW